MIVVAGESLVDVVTTATGETTEAVGGSPLNVAVGLGRLDVPVTLVTEYGDDTRGQAIARHLAASEVQPQVRIVNPTAVAQATVDAEGVASYEFSIDWDPRPDGLIDCDALHVGSLGLLLDPGRGQLLDLIDVAYGRGVFLSYDPNLRPSFVDDTELAWRDLENVAERCSLVKLSDEDARLLHPHADPADIARSLLTGERTELVVLTRGGEGATAFVDGGSVSVVTPKVAVVDTVGAGDSFMAALLAILYDDGALSAYGPGLPADEAGLRRLLGGAAAVAGVTVARRGANPPTRGELDADWPTEPA